MSDESRYPNVAPQHDIDRRAKAAIGSWLAADWLVRPLAEADYGLDYMVEGKAGIHPSGQIFYVQLKGSQSVRFDATGRLGWPMETKHLRYYWEKVTHPVFLFAVDVAAGCGWFVFIQGELNSQTMLEKLERQQTLTIELKLDHTIHDTGKLREAVSRSLTFMRERYPGSLQAAFRVAAQEYEQIDPNFSIVKSEVTNGRTLHTIAPRRDFSFSINIPADKHKEVAPKLEELFKFGRPIELTSAEADFTGLPLFGDAKARGLIGGIQLRPDQTTQGAATDGEPFTLTIPATLSGGSEGVLLVAKAEDSPLGLELKVTRDMLKKAGSGNIQITWDMRTWIGKDLRSLPWIEPIARFWEALFASHEISLTITVKGNRLVRGGFGRKEPPEAFRPHLELCGMLFKIHELAIARGFKIQLPEADRLWDFDWDDVAIAYDVEFKGRHTRSAPNYCALLQPAPDNTEIRKLVAGQASPGGWAKLILHPYTIHAFGQTLDMGDAESEVGPVTCKQAAADEFEVELRGEATTTMTITRLPSGAP
jgi:hypothetical protein